MSAKLQQAIADKSVVVFNRTVASVQVHTPEKVIIIPPQTRIDLTHRVSLAAIRRSSNLKGLVNSRTLDII